MGELKSGDKSKALCHNCKYLVSTTFQFRNVPFSDTGEIAKNILAGVCDECDSVVSIPYQSTPDIKEAYNKQSS